jgi:hypothetical protein
MEPTTPQRTPDDEHDHSWFDHAPSLFTNVPPAPQLRAYRRSALAGTGRREMTIIPQGFICTRKIERCYFPDKKVYEIETFWVPDPECRIYYRE